MFLVVCPIDRDFGSKFGCLLQNLVGEERSFLLRMTASVFRLGVIARSMQRVGQIGSKELATSMVQGKNVLAFKGFFDLL